MDIECAFFSIIKTKIIVPESVDKIRVNPVLPFTEYLPLGSQHPISTTSTENKAKYSYYIIPKQIHKPSI